MTEGESVSNLVWLLMEDRRLRDEQMAAERQEMAAERLRREEQAAAEKQQMLAQMEVLQRLVESANRGEENLGRAKVPAERREKVKLTKLAEQDDIEAYLTTFERMMAAHGVEEARKLAPQLTGHAQQAYAALPMDQTGNYEEMKAAILRRYDINEETYRQRFRSGTKKAGESYRELATRLRTDDALVVTTRAQAKQQREEEMIVQQREQESGVQPKAIEQAGDGSDAATTRHDLVVSESQDGMTQAVEGAIVEENDVWDMGNVLDAGVYVGGRERPKLSRRQKRVDRLRHGQRGESGHEEEQASHPLDISMEELRTLQETDTTLEAVRRAAGGEACSARVGFFRRDGLVYRRWTPPGRDAEDMVVEQLVLPLQCRKTTLQLAHDIPLAGHMRRLLVECCSGSTGPPCIETSQSTAGAVGYARNRLG